MNRKKENLETVRGANYGTAICNFGIFQSSLWILTDLAWKAGSNCNRLICVCESDSWRLWMNDMHSVPSSQPCSAPALSLRLLFWSECITYLVFSFPAAFPFSQHYCNFQRTRPSPDVPKASVLSFLPPALFETSFALEPTCWSSWRSRVSVGGLTMKFADFS